MRIIGRLVIGGASCLINIIIGEECQKNSLYDWSFYGGEMGKSFKGWVLKVQGFLGKLNG